MPEYLPPIVLEVPVLQSGPAEPSIITPAPVDPAVGLLLTPYTQYDFGTGEATRPG